MVRRLTTFALFLSCTVIVFRTSQLAVAQSLADRPFRGLSCFHCNADPKQGRAICNTLYFANLKNNATNFLVDATFGYDAAMMGYCMNLLSYGERNLKVLFYAVSGPGLRRCRDYKRLGVKGDYSGICPTEFNHLINTDARFRDYYRERVRTRIKPLVEHAVSVGAEPWIGWLEDNFNDTAFTNVLALTKAELGDLPVVYVRNSFGPGYEIPEGVREETHSSGIGAGHTDGIVFNDGYGFCWRREKCKPKIESYRDQRDDAGTWNNTHLLWVDLWQGLTRQGVRIQNPARRKYPMPRRDEQVEVWRFLRGG